ncbi:sugar phosphorylase, partial [Candidatus Roizmanbacteria bacterium]|nr:sugar phosphorylase [Candidatus Roizmanbacteria bacterium]
MDSLLQKLQFLYPDKGEAVYKQLLQIIENFKKENPKLSQKKHEPLFTEKDVILSCYADHVQEPGVTPLQSLRLFLQTYANGLFSTIHLLPFSPYSSDDGYSVIDYYRVKKEYGEWDDIHDLAKNFRLMTDLVINHASRQSFWFQEFLQGNPKYQDFFISFANPDIDLSSVRRPRSSTLLTPFQTKNGKKYVWTTFSQDQIDLNFKNPQVLLEMINVSLYLLKHNAGAIRLDAVGYIWKEIGTTSYLLPEVHTILQLLREIIETTAPTTWLATETKTEYEKSKAFFGNSENESHFIYDFCLPPLLLYSFIHEDSSLLTQWAKKLTFSSEKTSLLTITATHDGVGLTPVTDIFTPSQIKELTEVALKRGGKITLHAGTGGIQKPYELNIVYFDMFESIGAFLASQ